VKTFALGFVLGLALSPFALVAVYLLTHPPNYRRPYHTNETRRTA